MIKNWNKFLIVESLNGIIVTDAFLDREGGQIEVSFEGEDISFGVSNSGDVFFNTDEDYEIASSLNLIIDDELQEFLISEYNKKIKENRMLRFGFFKPS